MNAQHPTTPAGADVAPFVPLVHRLARQHAATATPTPNTGA